MYYENKIISITLIKIIKNIYICEEYLNLVG